MNIYDLNEISDERMQYIKTKLEKVDSWAHYLFEEDVVEYDDNWYRYQDDTTAHDEYDYLLVAISPLLVRTAYNKYGSHGYFDSSLLDYWLSYCILNKLVRYIKICNNGKILFWDVPGTTP